MTNWLITGGCGFIGSSLVNKLLSDPSVTKIRVLDNLSVCGRDDLARVCDFNEHGSGLQPSLTSRVELLIGDIRNQVDCETAVEGMDAVVHLAANTGVGPSVEDPMLDCMSNVVGTLNMLEASRRSNISRFVFASSGAPIGEATPPIHEEMPAHPMSPYGASKLSGEGYCSAYYHCFGLETVALRFGNVYGPGSYHKQSVVAKFIKQILSGDELEIYGDGKQTRDYIFIDDLLDAIGKSVTVSGVGGEVFQIATNHETTINELVEKLFEIIQLRSLEPKGTKFSAPRVGDMLRNFSDTRKARNILGWQVSHTLEQGLLLTLDDFLAQQNK